MKIFVKTLKNTHFEIEVKPEDAIEDVKKNIETVQGSDVYPASQQMLIHQGKVLKDGSRVEENKIAENSFIVIMLTKSKSSSSEGGSTSSTTATTKAPQSSTPPPVSALASSFAQPPVSQAPSTPQPATATPGNAPVGASVPSVTSGSEANVYGQAASTLVAGSNLENTIQQILDMGGGTWDRDTVVRALRAAYNNPERAVEYLYSGIPQSAEAPPVSRAPSSGQTTIPPAQPQQAAQTATVPSSGPNTATVPSSGPNTATVPLSGPNTATVPLSGPNVNPLDLFPQGLPSAGSNPAGSSTLDFLRNSNQFQAIRAMVQANPQILQPLLQELGKQNPQLMRLIQEHQADFLRMLNEPLEGGESNILSQLAGAMPQALEVTPEEREAIERLEAMGFDRALVLEVFFACNKNEELAANYLLDHSHEFEE